MTIYLKRDDVMKKLFISCPMKGRTKENIENTMKKMHEIAECTFDQKLEIINSYIYDEGISDDLNKRVYFLGKSIQLMSQADYFIGIKAPHDWIGCLIETIVAYSYDIEHSVVDADIVMNDLEK